MSIIVNKAHEQIKNMINGAISSAQEKLLLCEGESKSFAVEVPADRANGDFSTNAAMVNFFI